MGFFAMTEKGLTSIDNPSEYFVTRRKKEDAVSGSAITVLREGSRAVVAEIESLVSNSFTAYPLRISENMKKDTLNTLLSVLEQRGGLKLYDKNVVVKTTGGLFLKEQAASLAVLMSIVSGVKDVTKVFVAAEGARKVKLDNLEVVECKNLTHLLGKIFPKGKK